MLKFATFASDLELPFFISLANNKINHDKLDDSARRVLGLYEIRPSDEPEASCRLQVHGNALSADSVPIGLYRAEGLIKNVNTIEDYKGLDKGAFLHQVGRTLWASIIDGTIFSCPSLLASFAVICFADLKKYKFVYHFGFPALHSESPWRLKRFGKSTSSQESDQAEITSIRKLRGDETSALVEAVQTWRYRVDARQYGFFLAKRIHQSKRSSIGSSDEQRPKTSRPTEGSLDSQWEIGALADYEQGFFVSVDPEDQFVCFADPSTYSQYPGWMLRNLLILVRRRWQLQNVQILCYRDIQSRRDDARSLMLSLEVASDSGSGADNESIPKITGWERNSDGKFTNKIANLGEYMDPQRLADQAVDLNLKLIKWRISPGLDLDSIRNTRCLLLGAGTLGSYVARNLMGWGVRRITFVDNGSVSFSNPVRQPLFNFNDCLAGGSKKAIRASQALTEIYPGVDACGHVLSVPMLGHPILDETSVKADFETLQQLIDNHDAIFLLMDSRESRWLPTMMGKSAGKIVMNAALGFDSFVVMRHGVESLGSNTSDLGCYFCNDVVAPSDSLADRTLDQQCTVTRPGVAAIASALLVELFVSLLQHTKGADAPAPLSNRGDCGEHPLGLVPHQIRGFLSNFENIVVKGQSYDRCSACCTMVLDTYRSDGWKFIQRALNEKGFVEELSGLAQVQREAEKALENVEWEEQEDDEDEDAEMI